MAKTPMAGLRLDPKLRAEVEAHQKRLQARTPYRNVTLSDALRDLLMRGLDAARREKKAAN